MHLSLKARSRIQQSQVSIQREVYYTVILSGSLPLIDHEPGAYRAWTPAAREREQHALYVNCHAPHDPRTPESDINMVRHWRWREVQERESIICCGFRIRVLMVLFVMDVSTMFGKPKHKTVCIHASIFHGSLSFYCEWHSSRKQ